MPLKKAALTILLGFLTFVIVFSATHATGFLHVIGAEPRTPSTTDNFWSGFGSDIQEFGIFAILWGLYYKHTCHKDGCYRFTKHSYNGTPWCHHHHPKADELAASRRA